MLDHARETVVVEHAYFSDDLVSESVGRAARGGTVDVVLPKEPDTHIYANRATFNRLLDIAPDTSLRIFLYPRMIHAQVTLVDGTIAAVGPTNLTPRSMRTAKESALFLSATDELRFAKALGERLALDIAESERVEEPYFLGRTDAMAGKSVW